jgi:hypothetical protein
MDNIAKQCDIKLVVKGTYEQLSDPTKYKNILQLMLVNIFNLLFCIKLKKISL